MVTFQDIALLKLGWDIWSCISRERERKLEKAQTSFREFAKEKKKHWGGSRECSRSWEKISIFAWRVLKLFMGNPLSMRAHEVYRKWCHRLTQAPNPLSPGPWAADILEWGGHGDQQIRGSDCLLPNPPWGSRSMEAPLLYVFDITWDSFVSIFWPFASDSCDSSQLTEKLKYAHIFFQVLTTCSIVKRIHNHCRKFGPYRKKYLFILSFFTLYVNKHKPGKTWFFF